MKSLAEHHLPPSCTPQRVLSQRQFFKPKKSSLKPYSMKGIPSLHLVSREVGGQGTAVNLDTEEREGRMGADNVTGNILPC